MTHPVIDERITLKNRKHLIHSSQGKDLVENKRPASLVGGGFGLEA
jgi:hypothetical protein